MRWKDLSGPERYRVIRMLNNKEVTMAELGRTFRVSRQTLSRAREQVEQAACETLEPKPPGRRAKSDEEVRIAALQEQEAKLRKELATEKKKVQIAQAFLDLERRMQRGEILPGEGKKKNQEKRRRRARRRKPKAQRRPGRLGTAARVAGEDDGDLSGNNPAGSGALDPKGAAD